MAAEQKKVIKTTSKLNKPINLPEVMSKIYQPNRVTNSYFPLTLWQSKVFVYLMYELQKPIAADMRNESYQQMEMFRNPDLIKIYIPLHKLTDSPSRYREIKKALIELASIVVQVPYKDKDGTSMTRITGLIRANISEKPNFKSIIEVEIEKKVANVLITIDKNDAYQPINFTIYYLETVLQAKSQYTARLYPRIASWKSKGGFSMPLTKLKEFLCLEDKYKDFKDFKKKVLEPVQADIFEKADCWFNCNLRGFKTKENGIEMVNFKVITPEFKKQTEKDDDYIINMLKTSCEFNNLQIQEAKSLLTDNIDRIYFRNKILEVYDFILKNNNNHEKTPIENMSNYVLKALKQQFNR